MIDPKLLEILACPETKENVAPANQSIIDKINDRIKAGDFSNRGGEILKEPIEAGLIREDKKYLYEIREDIPIMLIDQAIPLEGIL